MVTDGAIEDAVLVMLKTRREVIVNDLFPVEEWFVQVITSGEVGYEITIKEHIFSKFAEKEATDSMIVRSLVAFIFELIEKDLCDVQINSAMVS